MKTKEKPIKLTKSERRIAVIKDALQQVRRGVYSPATGTLCNIHYSKLYDIPENAQLQKFFTTKFLKEANCQVCQRGALLASTIRKENSFTKEDFESMDASYYTGRNREDKRLLRLFTAKQISLMETAFEVSSAIVIDYKKGDNPYDTMDSSQRINTPLNRKEAESAILFGIKYKDTRERQIAIFKNALVNNGIFKP